MHWLTISTVGCPKDTVNVYDSAGGFIISTSVEKSIANILQSNGDFITVYSVNCDKQTNTNDCGIYAIANAVSILYGLDPRQIIYKTGQLRDHLFQCMVQCLFKPFPHDEILQFEPEYNAISGFELYCSCRMPDHGFMFQCSGCKKWYHPEHQNITEEELSKRIVKCLFCKNKPKSKKSRKR